jgi:hypothetical protein
MHRLGLLHGDLNWRNILVRIFPARRRYILSTLMVAGMCEDDPARAEKDMTISSVICSAISQGDVAFHGCLR